MASYTDTLLAHIMAEEGVGPGSVQGVSHVAYLDKKASPESENYDHDAGGVWTIGYGATGPGITKGIVWDEDQAQEFVRTRVGEIEKFLDDNVKVDLTPGQREAMISLTYNVGSGRVKNSVGLAALNAGDFDTAYEELLGSRTWKIAGDVNHKRRVAERQMWNSEPVEKDRQYYVDRGLEVPFDPTDRGEMKQGFRHEQDVMRASANPPLAAPEEVEGLLASTNPVPAPQPEPTPAPQPEETAAPAGTTLRRPEPQPLATPYDATYESQVAAQKRADEIGWFDIVGGGWRQYNLVGNALANLEGLQVADADFVMDDWMAENKEAVDALGGNQERVGEILGRAISSDHADRLLRNLQKNQADNEMLAQAGMKSLAAIIPALFDVDIVLGAYGGGVGAVGKANKLRHAIQGALSAGIPATAIEATIMQNDPFRTGGDVALAGLSGLLLGGGIGAYQGYRAHKAWLEAEDMIRTEAEDIIRVELAREAMNNGDVSAAKRILGTGEEKAEEVPLAPSAERDAGKIVDDLPEQDFGRRNGLAHWINKLQRNLIGRTFFSENETIRKVAASIMEGGLLADRKAARTATAEGRANNLFQVAVTRTFRATDQHFKKWAEKNGYGSIQREVGIDAGERFYTEVGRALRNDVDGLSEEAVSAAAEIRPMLDEYAKLAREVGIPGFENPVENFFPRYWDEEKLTRLVDQGIDRDTQGQWFAAALKKHWDEVNPPPDTTKLHLELGDEQVRLDSAVAEAQERVALAEEGLTLFRPRQKGISVAKGELKRVKAELREAEKAAKDHAKFADEQIKFAEAEIDANTIEELATLRTEVEDLRARAESTKGDSPERYDLRKKQKELHDLEEKVNRKIRRAEGREAKAERIGKAFARALARRNLGLNDMMSRGIPLDDADRMHQLLDGTGLSKQEIDDFVEDLRARQENATADAGNVSHGKQRLHFDETLKVKVQKANGETMMLGLEDMTVTDASKALPRYFKQMSGWIGLAKEAGIRGQGDIDKILIRAKETGASHDEVTALQDAFKLITGRSIEADPAGFGSQASRVATAWNYPRFGASFGVAQLPEIGNIVGEIGFAGMLRDIPDMGRLIKLAKNGQLEDATAREIDEIIGAGTDYITRRAQRNFSVDDGVQMAKGLRALDAGSARAGRITQIVSLMAPINAMLERFATRGIMRDWGKLAQKGFDSVPEWKRARLRNAGLSDDMQKRVFASLKAKGKYDDRGILEVARPHTWDDIEAADAYRMALDRERRMTVQRNDIGNTGSYIHKPLGRVMTQFMNFMLNSINKQLVRGVHFRDIQTFVSWSSSMFIGALAYTGQTAIDYANDDEKRKERLSTKRIIAAAYQRAGFSAITVPIIDSTLALAGLDQWFNYGRTSALGTDFVTGNPTLSGASDLLYTAALPLRLALNEDYEFNRADAQRMQRLILWQRVLGLKNVFHALEEDLPAQSK